MDFFSEFSKARRQGSGLRALFNMSPMKRREALWGLAFIAPWLIGFLIFYLAPMIASLVFSVYDFTLSNPDEAKFIGLDNWIRMLRTPEVWETMFVTFRFAVISLPIGMVTSFLVAVLLNSRNLIGRNVFRTLFYAPTMIPGIASILIWSSVLNSQTGWVNRLISLTGWDVTGVNGGLRWLNDPNLIYIAYTFIGLYGIGNAILINLASLQGVPTELYEAAEIDGANWTMRLIKITIPMVTPVIFYNLVLGVVGLLQYFIVPWILNRGDGSPEGTTNFYMIYFYKQAFTFQNMGYGAALAWLMFFVALLITLFLFWSGRFWVYYSGERD